MSNMTTYDLDDDIQLLGSSGPSELDVHCTHGAGPSASRPQPQGSGQSDIAHRQQRDNTLDTLERRTRGPSVSESSAVSFVSAVRQRERMGWLTTSQLSHHVHSVPTVSDSSRHHSQGSSRRYQSRHLAKKSGHGVNHGKPVVKVKFKRRLTRRVDEVYRRLFASQAHRVPPRASRIVPSGRIEEPLGYRGRVARAREPVRTEEVVEDGRTVVKRFWPSVRIGQCVLKARRRRAIKLSASSHQLMSS
jgi:hypothetical protein